jgi:predicted nucleotidyltransferase
MKSGSDQISSKEEVEEILRSLGDLLDQPVLFLVIGGAAMLEYGLKDVTKDIDLVCKDQEGEERLLGAAKALGFQVVGPEKRHARLGLDRVAIKGGHTLDIFGGRISYDFGLSEAMWIRGRRPKTLGKAEVRYAALEDIFILKLIANRERDIEDCESLAPAGLDYEVVYSEVQDQYGKAGTIEEKIWITYIEEGVGRLEEEFGLVVPIADRISALANRYRNRLYKDLTG